MRLRGTRWALFAIALLSMGLLGAGISAAVLHPFAPAALAPGATATEAAVVVGHFSDERKVQLSLNHGGIRQLTTPASGRLTSLDCTAGTTLKSGSAPASIDGSLYLALATRVPLWRDLKPGASGTDVDALQTELTHLGYRLTPDGKRIGRATLAALTDLAGKTGAKVVTAGSITVGRLLWIPDRKAPVASCDAAVGTPVQTGQSLASFPPALTGAKVTALPDRLLPGERTLTVDDVRMAVNTRGVVDDKADLASLSGTAAYLAAVADPNTAGVPALLRLKKPVNMAVLPPSAIVGADQRACVLSGDSTIPVAVVGSELGQSYVTFEGTPPTVVRLAPPSDTTCG